MIGYLFFQKNTKIQVPLTNRNSLSNDDTVQAIIFENYQASSKYYIQVFKEISELSNKVTHKLEKIYVIHKDNVNISRFCDEKISKSRNFLFTIQKDLIKYDELLQKVQKDVQLQDQPIWTKKFYLQIIVPYYDLMENLYTKLDTFKTINHEIDVKFPEEKEVFLDQLLS